MTLTTREAADELGVSEGAVWNMVWRGELTPINPGSRPLRFHLLDVIEAGLRRMPASRRARLDRLSTMLDNEQASCEDSG